MKKLFIYTILSLCAFVTKAQVELSTKSVEFEVFDKVKGWKLLDAQKDEMTGGYHLIFGQAICDMSKSVWTGDRTFRGLKWTIDDVVFSETFEYQKTESKSYSSSEEAILDNQFVFGKAYKPRPTKMIGGAGITKPLNNSYMFTNIITPTATLTGFKINTSYISCWPIANDTKYHGTVCGEEPVADNISNEDAKEEKGQRWIPMYSNPIPNGGIILFNTVGVIKEEKNYYVFRKYNENGTVMKEQTLTFDNQSLITAKEFETSPGVFDYYFVVTPLNYKKSKQPVSAATQYEIIKIEGENLEIEYRVKVDAPMSRWRVDQVFASGDEVYVFGQCADNKEDYDDFKPYESSNYEGFMMAKVVNGKLDYVKGYNLKEASVALKTVTGTKGKATPTYVFTSYTPYLNNGKFFITGQTAKEISMKGVDSDAVSTMVFDEKGNLEAYLARPESDYTRTQLHFSKDGKTMYWSSFDYASYNKLIDEGGGMEAKHKLGLMSGLNIVKYNVATKELGSFQSFNNEEWALWFESPVLCENDEEVIFKGKKITKKAKESEMVFITLKK